MSSREAVPTTNTSSAKPSTAHKSPIPRILNVRLRTNNSRVQAVRLDPELSSHILTTLSLRRALTIYEEQAQTPLLTLDLREKEIVKQVRELSEKLRRLSERPENERTRYSLQCAIQVLEEERQTFQQRKEGIERDLALRREKLSLEQAKIDHIVDTAFTTAKLMASRDEDTPVRQSSGEFEIDPLVFKENESPLRKIIAERRKHFEIAKERLTTWREANNQGDDHRSEAQGLYEQREFESVLEYELEAAEEGYKCLLDAERNLGMEEGNLSVPKIIVTPPKSQRLSVKDLVGRLEKSEQWNKDVYGLQT
jgi:hypothetical protein